MKELTTEFKSKLQKIKHNYIRNRPRSMLDDDYLDWKDINDYNKKVIMVKFLQKQGLKDITRDELVNYKFNNINYDKIQRKIICMNFIKNN